MEGEAIFWSSMPCGSSGWCRVRGCRTEAHEENVMDIPESRCFFHFALRVLRSDTPTQFHEHYYNLVWSQTIGTFLSFIIVVQSHKDVSKKNQCCLILFACNQLPITNQHLTISGDEFILHYQHMQD